MKTKWFFVYIGVGIAFAAVSLWVFLSGGKSARVIRSKYKLGGMLLMAWTMLSAATCNGPGPMVSCYDVANPNGGEPEVTCYDVAVQETLIQVRVKGGGLLEVKNGDVIIIEINAPDCGSYACKLYQKDKLTHILQQKRIDIPEGKDSVEEEWTIAAGDFKGEATLQVTGLTKDNEGKEIELNSNFFDLTIQ